MSRETPERTSRVAAGVMFALAIATLLAPPVVGQDAAAAPADPAQDEAALARIEAELSELEADAGTEDAVKDLLRPKYKQAIALLREAEEFDERAATYREAVQSAPERAEQYRAQLQALPPADQAAQLAPPESTDALQRRITARKAELQRLQDDLAEVSGELTRVKGRPPEVSSRLPEVERELAEVQAELALPEFAGEAATPGRRADRILREARQAKLHSELEMLTQEQASQAVREAMLQAQQDLLTRQAKIAKTTLDALGEQYQDRLTREAQDLSSQVAALPQNLPENDRAVQALAREVQSWAAEFDRVVTQLRTVTTAHDRTAAQLQELTREYEDLQSQIDLGSRGRAMTQYLLDFRRRLPDPDAYAARREAELPDIDQTRLQALQVENALREQADVERRFDDRSSDAVARLVEIRGDVLAKLRDQYRELVRGQAALEAEEQQYLAQASEVRAYVIQELFWMQNSPPVGLASLKEIPSGLRWIFRREHWVEFGHGLLQALTVAPWRCLGFVLALAALLVARSRIAAALAQTGVKIRRISTDRFSYTIAALGWTVLLAAPIPLAIELAAWALGHSLDPSDWMQGARYGLGFAARYALAAAFFAEICLPGGVGAAHFGWRKDVLVQIRRAIFWTSVVLVPALVLTASCVVGDASRYFGSVGRISFILAHVWLIVTVWRRIASSQGVLAMLAGDQPANQRRHGRHWRLAIGVAALSATLALLAAAGYVIAAFELTVGLLATAALIAGGAVFYRLLLRWFTIKQRRLALAEGLQRRRARQEALASTRPRDGASPVAPIEVEEEEELDLESVTEQTRHVLQFLVALLVAIAVALSWSGTFALLQFLEAFPVPLVGGMTLLELGQILLVLGVMWVVARNLPGLLELLVLRATTMSPGTRIAIATLAQYAVIAVGISVALNLLNVDWATFGWIAAALSVGLGFGLQEVVANFVCGLILLFERPIRVGDVVTVEGTTGTVTRIHMRATTIINWDRQEFVVPNKTLITNTILNWTLSTTTNRVTIAVGVAYGSDTEKARQMLLEIAADNANVLDDPAPLASFEEFADSALTLCLRAYVPDMDNFLNTKTELHTEIHKRFAEAGIEIAFPQRDLHLRGGWDNLRQPQTQAAPNDDEQPQRLRGSKMRH